MGHATTQGTVTVINPLELFQAFAARSTKRNEAILRGRVATGMDTSPVKIKIDEEETHGFFIAGDYPEDVTATCTLRVEGYDDVTLVLDVNGWTGIAKSLN